MASTLTAATKLVMGGGGGAENTRIHGVLEPRLIRVPVSKTATRPQSPSTTTVGLSSLTKALGRLLDFTLHTCADFCAKTPGAGG